MRNLNHKNNVKIKNLENVNLDNNNNEIYYANPEDLTSQNSFIQYVIQICMIFYDCFQNCTHPRLWFDVFIHYQKHSILEIKRHKCNYCLGCCR